MNLKRAIEYHKEKRKEDSNAIMTVVFKSVASDSHVKPIHDDLTVAMDSKTNQILLFDNSINQDFLHMPQEIIDDHPAVKFRTDLLDCHIDVCSPELLLQFSDNFDYLDIRRHFIQNEVLNWELGMHIYGYTVTNEYAARVHDPRTYHCISHDIIHRWVYPIVPDTHLLHGPNLSHSQRFVYRDASSRVSRYAVIGDGVVIGEGTSIDSDVHITGTIIGRNCSIKPGARISNSHIWEGTYSNQDLFALFRSRSRHRRKRHSLARNCRRKCHREEKCGD